MRMTLRVRDLARVAQLVDEPLHHLLVLGDVRVQELEHEPLVDDRVLHQQHGAEGALADLLRRTCSGPRARRPASASRCRAAAASAALPASGRRCPAGRRAACATARPCALPPSLRCDGTPLEKRASRSSTARSAAWPTVWSRGLRADRLEARAHDVGGVSSARRASAVITSSRDLLRRAVRAAASVVAIVAGVAELAERAHDGRQRAVVAVRSRSSSAGSARLLPISASASTARSRTHQSLSLVASIR